jgi:hypothetical protein
MAAFDSLDPLAAVRPATIQPARPADIQAPGQNLPAPTDEQVRATEAIFTTTENPEAGAILGFWTAGMLLHDLLRDAAGHLARDEAEEEKRQIGIPPAPLP